MQTRTNLNDKNNAFKLSTQVKNILQEKGLSKVFNYSDYEYFKKQCRNAWNKAQAIAEKFIEDNNPVNSDYDEYIF